MPSFAVDPKKTTTYLSDLVSINSINPDLVRNGAGESEIAEWLAKTCSALGLEVSKQEVAPGRPNVIAHWPGKGKGKSLLLTGHVDVVSVEGMTIEPFKPQIKDGRLYGRGSYDMKGGLAAILGGIEALRRGRFEPTGDIYLGFVVDEEYKSIGMEALVQKIHPDAAILTEPTEMKICLAHKGFLWLTLTTHAKAAHGSDFVEGVDAILQMGRLIQFLERLELEVLPGKPHPLLKRPSAHASIIEGGLGLSTYPDRCDLKVEHRLLPDEEPADVLKLWRDEIKRLKTIDPKFKAEVRAEFFRPGYEVEQNAPIVKTLHRGFTQALGKEPSYMGMGAWLDSAILGGAGIPTVILGPTGSGAHAAVEYVELESVLQCASVLAEVTALWMRK
ncbi:ArgE/DapE family deacylase [Candidatus Acetothermia bacterium]|nr:ArgE/DapE family deacylase [Candidatus Acetothermia bacterium]MBI3643437.1 ArgE/DapE family deacylase [Candidatus Acetothermia bacterium]